jgi:ABC-type dipeptide/oligopeptide/nickel transport system ATPase subunit
MKKIDLHVHTKSTASDRPFIFSPRRLQDYVQVRAVDCIAVTNHNEFDLGQFEAIRGIIDITVLPGIEIDLEGGQILLIGDGSDLKEFDLRCKKISSRSPTKADSISVDELRGIFGDLSKYIVIPHYDKKPEIKDETLLALGTCVTAGEVTSPKKFMYCMRSADRLVPVYFSDCRIEETSIELPVRQTYVACEEATFAAIKNCLRDKHKVALSADDGNRVFQVFDDGQLLSTGLNVILGKRSSGKSHTLKRIRDAMPNARYIEQFSLVARNEEEDEKKFNGLLSDKHSLFSREYLRELQTVVNEFVDIDLAEDLRRVDAYLKSLLKHAKESEKHDAFSRAKLFSEEKFPILEQKGLEDLIASTQNLIENVEFRKTVDKHVSIDSLKALIIELMTIHGNREQERRKKNWVNDLVSEIKKKLQTRTAATSITDLDLYTIAINRVNASKFDEVVRAARTTRELMRKPLQGFELVATADEFEGAMELKRLSRLKVPFREAYDVYTMPYDFLQELKKIEGIEEADLYKYFVKIEFKILNDDGYEVSGGERSEFNLLQEIEDAQRSDILLIDEPESSFDNLFLKDSVNEIIKELSKSMPVVLVTHNNTVGASIRPDYLLYTSKDIEDRGITYRMYSGFPSSKRLKSPDGNSVSTWEITMGCLEAGADAYNDRRNSYEDIRD